MYVKSLAEEISRGGGKLDDNQNHTIERVHGWNLFNGKLTLFRMPRWAIGCCTHAYTTENLNSPLLIYSLTKDCLVSRLLSLMLIWIRLGMLTQWSTRNPRLPRQATTTAGSVKGTDRHGLWLSVTAVHIITPPPVVRTKKIEWNTIRIILKSFQNMKTDASQIFNKSKTLKGFLWIHLSQPHIVL